MIDSVTDERSSAFPPGFYDDGTGTGTRRWWDGHAWTQQVEGAETPVAAEKPRELARHPLADDPSTIWSAVGRPITGIGAGKYRLTEDLLFFERGTFGVSAQQVHTWEIRDVDAAQGLLQRQRQVGTITIHALRATGPETVVLEDVPDFREGVRLINETARAAGERKRSREQTQHVNYSGAPAFAAPPAVPAAAPGAPVLDQLKELAALKTEGLLTEEEFAAAKAKLLGL